MQDIMLYIIISILLVEILCGGILGSILIKRMSHMSEIIHRYEKRVGKTEIAEQSNMTGQANALQSGQPVVTLTEEEREMLAAPLPCNEQHHIDEEEVIEDFLREFLSC